MGEALVLDLRVKKGAAVCLIPIFFTVEFADMNHITTAFVGCCGHHVSCIHPLCEYVSCIDSSIWQVTKSSTLATRLLSRGLGGDAENSVEPRAKTSSRTYRSYRSTGSFLHHNNQHAFTPSGAQSKVLLCPLRRGRRAQARVVSVTDVAIKNETIVVLGIIKQLTDHVRTARVSCARKNSRNIGDSLGKRVLSTSCHH